MATAFAAASSLAAAKLAPVSQIQARKPLAPAKPAVICRSSRRSVVSATLEPREAEGVSLASLPEVYNNERTQTVVASAMAGSLFSMLAYSDSAMAAQEVMQLAVDSRPLLFALPVVAALGWVAFNILGPALNQLNKMLGSSPATSKATRAKRSVIGALGLGAAGSLLLAPQADAAQEVMQLAVDARPALFALPVVAALGWVAFNIAQPGINQWKKMTGAKGVVGAVGIGAASMLVADQADAAQEMMQLAVDSRPLLFALPVVAALGWVLFNIAGPALNQVNRMLGNSPATKGTRTTRRK